MKVLLPLRLTFLIPFNRGHYYFVPVQRCSTLASWEFMFGVVAWSWLGWMFRHVSFMNRWCCDRRKICSCSSYRSSVVLCAVIGGEWWCDGWISRPSNDSGHGVLDLTRHTLSP